MAGNTCILCRLPNYYRMLSRANNNSQSTRSLVQLLKTDSHRFLCLGRIKNTSQNTKGDIELNCLRYFTPLRILRLRSRRSGKGCFYLAGTNLPEFFLRRIYSFLHNNRTHCCHR